MVILFPGCYYYGDAMEEVPWVEDLDEWNIAVGNCFVFRRKRKATKGADRIRTPSE